MRVLALIVTFLSLVACEPVIGHGTYYCGPERGCPPEQQCDDSTFTCERPADVLPFACPENSQNSEPDGAMSEARDLGPLSCAETLLPIAPGCIPSGNDEDYYAFSYGSECAGDAPHLEVTLRFPVALVPLVAELLEDTGTVLATGVPCTPPVDFSGKDSLCIERVLAPGAAYFVRVKADPEGADCSGDCHFNQYTLDIKHPLS